MRRTQAGDYCGEDADSYDQRRLGQTESNRFACWAARSHVSNARAERFATFE